MTTNRAWLIGMTASTNFPTAGSPYQAANRGNYDGFVIRLNSAGSALEAGTLIGGLSTDALRGLALGADGRVYAVGLAASTDYPVVAPDFQTTKPGGYDYVRSIFDGNLSTLVCSTYAGTTSSDYGQDIELVPAMPLRTIIGGCAPHDLEHPGHRPALRHARQL